MLKSPRKILFGMAIVVGCIALFSFLSLSLKLVTYVSLQEEGLVKLDRVEILELSDVIYMPKAFYAYNNQPVVEIIEIMEENNPYMLEGKIREWVKDPVKIYRSFNYCTLQKCFPIKQSIYTLILVCLTLYFIFLAKRAYR
jgi:hypothetical protein